jgi:hypothetical protein
MVEETAGLLASISTLNNGPTTQLLTALVPLPTPGSAPDLSFPRSLPAKKAAFERASRYTHRPGIFGSLNQYKYCGVAGPDTAKLSPPCEWMGRD